MLKVDAVCERVGHVDSTGQTWSRVTYSSHDFSDGSGRCWNCGLTAEQAAQRDFRIRLQSDINKVLEEAGIRIMDIVKEAYGSHRVSVRGANGAQTPDTSGKV